MAAAAADPCCQEADAFNSEAAACEALACDPTLESCCQRDLEQQAVVARLKARLSIHDRSKERLRVAARVLGTAGQPSPAPPPAADRQSDDDLATDEDDEELGRLHALRLQQLQREARLKAQLRQEGHGSLTDVPEARLLRVAGEWGGPMVSHLALEGAPLCEELDEQLASLAHQHQGTRFTRTLADPRAAAQPQLRSLPCPGLVCFLSGCVVGAASLQRFGAPECLREEAVGAWLRRLGVLRSSRSSSSGGGPAPGGDSGSGSGSGSGEEEGEGDEWQQPCVECGRRYPHQHVRSARVRRGSGSDSD